jgi:hypothetical protein
MDENNNTGCIKLDDCGFGAATHHKNKWMSILDCGDGDLPNLQPLYRPKPTAPILCRIFGHKTVHEVFTGEYLEEETLLGTRGHAALYKYQRTPFCTRCGVIVHHDELTTKE